MLNQKCRLLTWPVTLLLLAQPGWRCRTWHTIKMQLPQPLLFTLITCLSS